MLPGGVRARAPSASSMHVALAGTMTLATSGTSRECERECRAAPCAPSILH